MQLNLAMIRRSDSSLFSCTSSAEENQDTKSKTGCRPKWKWPRDQPRHRQWASPLEDQMVALLRSASLSGFCVPDRKREAQERRRPYFKARKALSIYHQHEI